MPDVEIGKLAIEVPGLTAEQGRRLAQLIVDGLGGIRWPDHAAASKDRASVTVAAEPGKMALEQLADTVVCEILRQMA
jgi:hypothetical protein